MIPFFIFSSLCKSQGWNNKKSYWVGPAAMGMPGLSSSPPRVLRTQMTDRDNKYEHPSREGPGRCPSGTCLALLRRMSSNCAALTHRPSGTYPAIVRQLPIPCPGLARQPTQPQPVARLALVRCLSDRHLAPAQHLSGTCPPPARPLSGACPALSGSCPAPARPLSGACPTLIWRCPAPVQHLPGSYCPGGRDWQKAN